MNKFFPSVVMCVLLIGVLSGSALGAPSFLGTTGNILTPDDLLLSTGSFSANFHAIDVEDSDSTMTIIGANVGVTPNLELGIARFDFDTRGADEATLVNVKYLLMPEAPGRPSVVIGAVDLSGDLDPDDDPGFYVVLGKNLTPAAANIAGRPVTPLKGYLGLGGGIYNGLFGALDWTVSSRVSVMVEVIGSANIRHLFHDESVFNVGARIALTDQVRADIALIDADDLGFGISYTKLSF